MKNKTLIFLVILINLYGCDNTAELLAKNAEVCDVAETRGIMDTAEEYCEQALDPAKTSVLSADVRSERLFRLARIKRQLGKFAEGLELVQQSLALEETVSGADSLAVARRQLELSLLLAGLGKWTEGAEVLDKVLSKADQLDENEKASMANILRNYSRQLGNTQQSALASRFSVAANALIAENPPTAE